MQTYQYEYIIIYMSKQWSVEVLVSTTLDILHVAHAPRYPGSQVVDHASPGYPWSNQV